MGHTGLARGCLAHWCYRTRTKPAEVREAPTSIGGRGCHKVSKWLEDQEEIEVLNIKDYIAYPKENGYRSYHMIINIKKYNLNAEIQIRTIALDFWANLEHQMKYKKHIKNEHMIRGELKRCADEIASVDLSMQTIKDLIFMN